MRVRLAAVGRSRASTGASRRWQAGTQARQASGLAQHPTRRDEQGRLLSRTSGPREPPLTRETLAQFWQRTVRHHPARPALIVRHEPPEQHGRPDGAHGDGLRWTYAAMHEHVARLASALRTLHVRRGDRVAVLMMNNSAMAALQIATAFLGAVLVTLNPSYTPAELLHALNHVQASHLFLVPSLRSSNYLDHLKAILPTLQTRAARHMGDPTRIQDDACPSLQRIVLVDNLSRRPRQWDSESILAQHKARFVDALDALHGHAIPYSEVLARAARPSEEAQEEEGMQCHDIINLQLTSGTTGSPKAVALSSHNLVNNGIMLGQLMHLTHEDVLANVPPLFHCFGLTLGNLAAWSAGAAVVYPSEGFHPVRALRAAAQEGATALHGVPAHFNAQLDILRRIRQAETSGAWASLQRDGIDGQEPWQFKLRTGFTSGATVPIELMRAIMDDTLLGSKEQTVVYGMTETSPVSFGCDTRAEIELRCKTVGQVVPHVEAKIVSPDDPDGTPIPVGQVGELCTAGYIVMDGGYWKDAEQTAQVLQVHADEPEITWMRTGDLAAMREDGYTEIRGRVKDLIIRGGENISSVGIENCIDALHGVASCAAVSVPCDKMGETVGVFIRRLRPFPSAAAPLSPPAVRAHVKAHLSGPCAPEWVWFLGEEEGGVPSSWPTTASGKVQKVILRQWARSLAARGVGRAKGMANG